MLHDIIASFNTHQTVPSTSNTSPTSPIDVQQVQTLHNRFYGITSPLLDGPRYPPAYTDLTQSPTSSDSNDPPNPQPEITTPDYADGMSECCFLLFSCF